MLGKALALLDSNSDQQVFYCFSKTVIAFALKCCYSNVSTKVNQSNQKLLIRKQAISAQAKRLKVLQLRAKAHYLLIMLCYARFCYSTISHHTEKATQYLIWLIRQALTFTTTPSKILGLSCAKTLTFCYICL